LNIFLGPGKYFTSANCREEEIERANWNWISLLYDNCENVFTLMISPGITQIIIQREVWIAFL